LCLRLRVMIVDTVQELLCLRSWRESDIIQFDSAMFENTVQATQIAPVTDELAVRVDHVIESRDVMNIHVVEHSILNGTEYCTFWFRSVVEMTRHQLLLH
jgi:hypothetical protein